MRCEAWTSEEEAENNARIGHISPWCDVWRMDAYVSLTSTHSGKMTALQRQVQMKITILVTWVSLLCFSSQQSASERLHNNMSYIQLKCLERVEQMDTLWTRWEWDWWRAASQSHGKSSQQASQIPWYPASQPKWPIRHVYSSPPPSADAALSGPNEKRWQLWVKLISVAIKTQLSENKGQQRRHSRGKKADKQRRTTRKRANEETLPTMRLCVVSFKRILYEMMQNKVQQESSIIFSVKGAN